MQVLLDTHALLWWLSDDAKLSRRARTVIGTTSNTVFVSAASAWEIATKVRLGKLASGADLASDFEGHLEREGFLSLQLTVEHAVRAGYLPGEHRDPFDRMLIAQAQAENLQLVSKEELFDGYGVRRIW